MSSVFEKMANLNYQTDEINKSFVSSNIFLSVTAMILTIFPAFGILIMCFFSLICWPLFILLGLYILWISSTFLGIKTLKGNKTGKKTKILFVVNSITSIVVLLGCGLIIFIMATANYR